jgi:hypothetical protein
MNRYQLAKIVQWTGTLHSRKRMQKMVFLLQAAGCPLNAEYDLHYYGPYSQDVAQLTDELTRANLLAEQVETHPQGERYSYSLTQKSIDQIRRYEADPRGLEDARGMEPYESRARALAALDLKELEVGATIVFFRGKGHDWRDAIDKTCSFKKLDVGTPFLKRCEKLAREIVDFPANSTWIESTISDATACSPARTTAISIGIA